MRSSEGSLVSNETLLIMDTQNGIVARLGELTNPLLDTLSEVLDAARAKDIPVIFVRVAFRPGAPEASPRNKSFAAVSQSDAFNELALSTQIHPRLEPREGEVVVVKRRVSAFSGSDLETVLRAKNIDTLVLTGIATSGVVLSTLRQAADMDYSLVVLSDACADADSEVHRVLTEKVFARQATVMTSGEWITQLASKT